MSTIIRETTPLQEDDLFALFRHSQAKFDYPLHIHSEYEINMVCNTSGKRIIGDSIEPFADLDIILVGPNLPHLWKAPTFNETTVITIYFEDTIVSSPLFMKKMFTPIREMLLRSSRGLDFSPETKYRIKDRLFQLSQSHGFNTGLDFFSLLYELATSPGQRSLASPSYDVNTIRDESKSGRIAAICRYIEENYHQDISLKSLADQIKLSESAFSHLFKKRTSRSFVEYLNEVRIGQATKMLLETTLTISEISYRCGFNNLSNFNKMFRKLKKQTPSEYRKSLSQITTRNY
ncbi:MAG: helix-turn-helix domain-containing protein [Pseudobacter sp.]|uniref:helix-turn-helix domain-containing protein n=1 Tax=Pseudobacter sp. TaxID=2045420 RepID=UPI003F7DAA69